MIDIDARGRHEAELLREEAALIADTETALQSVLDGVVLVPLVAHREASRRTAITRRPVSVRRRMAVLVGVAAAVVIAALLAFRPSNQPVVVPTATTAVTSSSELVVQPLDPPIECELELCPSLAVSPEGTLVAYDQAAKTLTWFDSEPHAVPVTADLDVEQVRLVAVGPNGVAYLLAGSPGNDAWELVAISTWDETVRRTTNASPDVDVFPGGIFERSCWSGCEPVRPLVEWGVAPYPDISYTPGTVTAVFGDLRWTIAWPHKRFRSQVAPRWGGGAVLSLIPELGDDPSELIELLPDGSVQRFGLGDEVVHVLLPDGSAVVWRDGQFVRLSPPQTDAWPAAWSPEMTAQALDPRIACTRSPRPLCPQLAVSPEGTLVALDAMAQTLTWYEDEPRVVPLTVELPPDTSTELHLVAIGPHDIAYILVLPDADEFLVAVAPSGAEITRADWTCCRGPFRPTATGIVQPGGLELPSPNDEILMPWVDLDGNPITDTRPYPTAKNSDAGIEVRLGEREWLLAGESWPPVPEASVLPRSDGGIAMLFDSVPLLLELLPDGTIEHYEFGRTLRALWPSAVLPDGSLIVEHELQLFRLSPPVVICNSSAQRDPTTPPRAPHRTVASDA